MTWCQIFATLDKCIDVDEKGEALKFALARSDGFKACYELYRCLNPEKSFKLSFKNARGAY